MNRFNKMKEIHDKYFHIDDFAGSFKNKIALISLICWLVAALKKKKPDVTYYQVIAKLADGSGLSEEDMYKYAIICEDFAYNCTDFITFNLQPKEIPAKIKELFCKALPF